MQWIVGGGSGCTSANLIVQTEGTGGQGLHNGVTNPTDDVDDFQLNEFSVRNGRISTLSINAAFQLQDSPASAGGFVAASGSHRARYAPPHAVRKG